MVLCLQLVGIDCVVKAEPVPLGVEPVLIGRAKHSDFRIEDPRCSRLHATVISDECGRVIIQVD